MGPPNKEIDHRLVWPICNYVNQWGHKPEASGRETAAASVPHHPFEFEIETLQLAVHRIGLVEPAVTADMFSFAVHKHNGIDIRRRQRAIPVRQDGVDGVEGPIAHVDSDCFDAQGWTWNDAIAVLIDD